MASNRRRSFRKLTNYVSGIDRRVKRLSRRPSPRSIAPYSIEGDDIAPDTIGNENIAPGTITPDLLDPSVADAVGGARTTISATEPEDPRDGDLWINTASNNEMRRYNESTSTWQSIRDLTIAAAQATADGKNRVFRQSTTPTATAVGDIWFDTGNDNRINRWSGTAWVQNNLGNDALTSISANKITAGTIDASVITVSNINAGNITVGVMSGARISAGTLDANRITAGTLSASQISTGTLSANFISGGTITASALNIGGRIVLPTDGSNIQLGTLSGGTVTQCRISSGFPQGFLIDTNASGVTDIRGQSIWINGGQFVNNREIVGLVTSSGPGATLAVSGGVVIRQTSKRNMKENIEDFANVDLIDRLRPVTFTWRGPGLDREETELERERRESSMHVGFIAEEVEEASDGLLSVYNYEDSEEGEVEMYKYLDIIALSVAAIKDLRSRVAALEGTPE